jgi:cellulose biosynthesis protein BcsQ
MTTIAFFNNKGGVGKTSLVYHLAWMYAELGINTLAVDLDPQSNLTAMFLTPERLEELWPDDPAQRQSILRSVRPFVRGIGDVVAPHVEQVDSRIGLVVGDLALSTFEDRLSGAWPRSMDRQEDAFRILSAFHRLMLMAEQQADASIALIDVGPNLGAINRAALIAADWVVTPLAPDMFSIQGLRNLGPTLADWRREWAERLQRRPADPDLSLPAGTMQPGGYVVMQTGMRLDRPVKAYDRWVSRIPMEYSLAMLGRELDPPITKVEEDPSCLGVMRHYHSLMPLAQDARKPMFYLRAGDGAIGAHLEAVQRCHADFQGLARHIGQSCRFPA